MREMKGTLHAARRGAMRRRRPGPRVARTCYAAAALRPTARFMTHSGHVTDALQGSFRPLIGASIPRSGHHHLARLLEGYFGPQLHYCSVYGLADCCGATPCSKERGRGPTYQKSHDFDFRLPSDVAGAVYLVQHRHPVSNALSGADLRARRSGFRPPSDGTLARAKFLDFLAARLAYYKRFHDKWVATPPPGAILIDHEALEAEPAATLRPIIEAAGARVDEARLAETVETLSGRGGGRSRVYKPRVVEESPFFDRSALGAFEAAVLAECPAYGYAPTLGGGAYKRHPVYLLAKLRHEYGRAVPSKRLTGFD